MNHPYFDGLLPTIYGKRCKKLLCFIPNLLLSLAWDHSNCTFTRPPRSAKLVDIIYPKEKWLNSHQRTETHLIFIHIPSYPRRYSYKHDHKYTHIPYGGFLTWGCPFIAGYSWMVKNPSFINEYKWMIWGYPYDLLETTMDHIYSHSQTSSTAPPRCPWKRNAAASSVALESSSSSAAVRPGRPTQVVVFFKWTPEKCLCDFSWLFSTLFESSWGYMGVLDRYWWLKINNNIDYY